MWTRESVKRAYGVDILDLEAHLPDALCGIVTKSGVIWRAAGSPALSCREDCLVEMLRTRGQEHCLFLSLGSTEDARIDDLLSAVPPTVELMKLTTGDCRCRVLFRSEAAGVS